jgi:hypothetical protein
MSAVRSAALTVVVLALAVVAALAAATRPGTPGAAVAALPATTGSAVRATLFCPDVRQLPGTLTTSVVVGTTTTGDGSVTLAPATKAGVESTLLRSGQRLRTDTTAPQGPVVVQAAGAPSGGLVAEQIARANKTSSRGWAEARCGPARSDQWFVGPATGPGDAPVVVLADPADSRAVLSVTVLTPTGLVAAPAGGNIVLAPHTVQTVSLTSLAPGVTATAVEVRTETGEVSAAVRDVRVHGLTPEGTDYVPVSEPSATQVVAGLPGTVVGVAPARILTVGNPGTVDATVQVTVTTATGSFVPVGMDQITVPAESLRSLDLGRALGTSAATVTVRSAPTAEGSPPPVVAGVLVDAASTERNGIHELTYLGSVGQLQGPALVPILVTRGAGDPADSVVVLSAPQDAATVTLLVRTAAGAAALTRTVRISAGTTVAVSMVRLKVPTGSSLTVTPEAGSGPVYGSRIIEEDGALGPLLSAFQLVGAPPLEQVPAVVPLPLGES